MQDLVLMAVRRPMMALSLALATLAGCNGAIWGNVSVLLITCGIFFGTLTLGRRAMTERGRSVPGAVSDPRGDAGAGDHRM